MATSRKTTAQRSRDDFLRELAKTGNVSQACLAAHADRHWMYEQRNRDAEFAASWEDALDQAADGLEQECYRRAVLGWDEAVYTNAGYQGDVHKYDGSLLALMMKAAKPEKYRENLKITGAIAHGLVPSGDARSLAEQLLDAVREIPAAREALSIRLLASGE